MKAIKLNLIEYLPDNKINNWLKILHIKYLMYCPKGLHELNDINRKKTSAYFIKQSKRKEKRSTWDENEMNNTKLAPIEEFIANRIPQYFILPNSKKW